MDIDRDEEASRPSAGVCLARVRACVRAELTSFVCALLALIGVLSATLLHDKIADGVRAGVLDYVIIRDESSGSFPAFLDSTDPSAGAVLSTYYIYNVTNAIDVVEGRAKPHVVAIGPLTYHYRVTRHNVSFEADGEELVYKECVAGARVRCRHCALTTSRASAMPTCPPMPPRPRAPPSGTNITPRLTTRPARSSL